jgi:4-hydroxy-2-oxoheptanedioate aldolase
MNHIVLLIRIKKIKQFYKMNTSLTSLKNFSVVGVKTSFEDEGAHPLNVYKLRSVTNKVGLDLNIKIGGAEAKTDFKMAMEMDSDSVVAPMIESSFALSKFTEYSKHHDITRGINIESKQGVANLKSILESKYVDDIDYICIGRSDLSNSYEQDEKYILSDEFCDVVTDALTMIKHRGLMTCMGGTFDLRSYDFVKFLYENELIDKVETRYIIFKADENFISNFDDAITNALIFEYEYMKTLHEDRRTEMEEYSHRCDVIKKRLAGHIDFV